MRQSLLLSALVTNTRAQSDVLLKQRVRDEYPTALAKLEARYGSMHGQARYRGKTFVRDQPVQNLDQKLDFSFAPGLAKISITSAKPEAFAQRSETAIYQSILGVNSKYAFTVFRRHPDDELSLKNIAEDLPRGRFAVQNAHGGQIQCAYYNNVVNMSLIFKYPNLQIDSASEVGEGEGPKQLLIRFSFRRDLSKPRPPNVMYADSWLVVAPGEGWITREYGSVLHTSDTVPRSTQIGKIEYARSADGHLDPIKLTEHSYGGRVDRNPTSPPVAGFDLTIEAVKYDALPEAEFRLPAFGLPEVAATGAKGASDRPYGLFAVAAAGFGLAGGLRYASMRLKRS